MKHISDLCEVSAAEVLSQKHNVLLQGGLYLRCGSVFITPFPCSLTSHQRNKSYMYCSVRRFPQKCGWI